MAIKRGDRQWLLSYKFYVAGSKRYSAIESRVIEATDCEIGKNKHVPKISAGMSSAGIKTIELFPVFDLYYHYMIL